MLALILLGEPLKKPNRLKTMHSRVELVVLCSSLYSHEQLEASLHQVEASIIRILNINDQMNASGRSLVQEMQQKQNAYTCN